MTPPHSPYSKFMLRYDYIPMHHKQDISVIQDWMMKYAKRNHVEFTNKVILEDDLFRSRLTLYFKTSRQMNVCKGKINKAHLFKDSLY